MDITFNISKNVCLDFFISNISKTSYAKKQINWIRLTFIMLIVLVFMLSKDWILSVLLFVIIFPFVLLSKKLFFKSFKNLFYKKINNNSLRIYLNNLILEVSKKTLIITSDSSVSKVEFNDIQGIYFVNNFILIINNNSKDILIPPNVFSSIEEMKSFLHIFSNIKIKFDFPKDYII